MLLPHMQIIEYFIPYVIVFKLHMSDNALVLAIIEYSLSFKRHNEQFKTQKLCLLHKLDVIGWFFLYVHLDVVDILLQLLVRVRVVVDIDDGWSGDFHFVDFILQSNFLLHVNQQVLPCDLVVADCAAE